MIRLAAEAITVRRGGQPLIEAISFEAAGGAFIALLGPNGAGKTTLLRTLAGLEAPQAGRATIDGADVRGLTPASRARKIAYLPQAREVAWAITAEAVVALGRYAFGSPQRLSAESRAAVERAIADAGAAAFRTRTMPTLSGGEQARVHLARALCAGTPVLLADEPTAALDPKHAHTIMRALRAKADAGAIVVAALHDLRLAQRFCTRIIALNGGRIAADDAPERALTPALIEQVFGVADH